MVSCGKDIPKEITYSGNALGTTFHIAYFDENEFEAEKSIDSVFQAINRSMSTYLENSDISRINNGDSTVIVDSMFAEVFRISKKIHQETNGYFDPTVGKLVNFYGFGPEKMQLKIDSTTIDSLMEYVGFDKMELTSEHKIKKTNPNIYIDFNAIAKGYAVDRLGKMLEQHGIENYLVEVGGELVTKGKNLASGKFWRIGIDDPGNTLQNRELSAIIELKNQGMATSGNYRKFRVDSVTGEKYVHTIDPLTGHPARNVLLSATILAKNCALADAYATSLMAMGLEKSKSFLKTQPGLEAYLIYAEKDTTKIFMTEGFKNQLVKE
jgi:thiamine biosynthesis lipoprotein